MLIVVDKDVEVEKNRLVVNHHGLGNQSDPSIGENLALDGVSVLCFLEQVDFASLELALVFLNHFDCLNLPEVENVDLTLHLVFAALRLLQQEHGLLRQVERPSLVQVEKQLEVVFVD